MSILRTYNVQNPDSASVNVELSANGGVRVAGLSTFSGELRVGTGVTISSGIITATSFTGNVTGNVNATGLSTFTSGINVGTGASISSPATNVLTLGTNNVERVRVDSSGLLGIGSATPGFQLTVDQATTDGNLVDFKNEEVRLLTGVWGTGSTYPREITLNATRFDSGAVPALRLAGQGGIKFAVDLNTVRMEIDSSGRVKMPYQPYARASCSSFVSATNAISLNEYNLSRGGITISGSRFTVPVAGAYVIGYHHLGNSGSGACQVEIRVNNTDISGTKTQDTNSSNDSFGTQTVRELSASDYVEFFVYQGTTHNNQDYNSMWIWLLG